MNDKEKYVEIKYELNTISNQINNMLSKLSDFETTMKDSILIDNQIYCGDDIYDIKEKIKKIDFEINNSILSDLDIIINS